MPDFYDITEPNEFLPEPGTPWWIWTLVVLAGLLVVGLLWFIIRKSNSAKQRATLLDKARKSLEKLRKQSDDLPPHGVAVHISLILRRYLAEAFNDPAIFETNEEFTLRESALAQLHPDSREPVSQYLTELSQIKYSPSGSADIPQLINQAEAVIANIEINVGDPDD